MQPGRRWSVADDLGNSIYLTDERWEHIVEGHPEMAGHEDELRETLRHGERRQDSLNPQKFRYRRAFRELADDNTHLEAVVLFRFSEEEGRLVANNYVATAYLKALG
ncbi:MAG TPA: hypothetical protein VJT67_05490 [Longimicrobiaceae bacterium]|nr:hypothetical protein [Longimicrobiaceae bacterium]